MTSNRGYASFHALVIMIFAAMAGAYLLRSASKEAGTAGSYFHMRGASTSAQAGLNAGVNQLERDTALAMDLLADYNRDHRNQWMLGGRGATPSANSMSLPGGQAFSTRIVAFDAETGMIKLEAQGAGLGGSSGRITGIFRLDGLATPAPASSPVAALFVAGDGRVVNAPLSVTGATYFGGGVRLSGAGNDFDGAFKTAAFGSNPLEISGSTTFRGPAYFETPVRFRAGTTVFQGDVGFDDDAAIDATARLSGSALSAYASGAFTGSQRLDLGRNPMVHSGFVSTARVYNASAVVRRESGLDVPGELAMLPGEEDGDAFRLSAIPADKIFTLDEVGLGASATGRQLTEAFHRHHNEDRFGPNGQFMVVEVNRPFAFARSAVAADNECFKWYIWIVRSTLTVNGNLFTSVDCPPPSGYDYLRPLQVFHVVDGGSIAGFGGPGRFRGYINVSGAGGVTYQWGAGGYLEGAVHHVSDRSGFAVAGPNRMRVTLDREVLDRVASLGLLSAPAAPPSAGTEPYLADARLRPKLLGLYY